MSTEKTIFISATSRDLASAREQLTKLLESYGFRVLVQKDYPAGTNAPFDEIDGKVIAADWIIGLVGYQFGQALPKNRPAEIPAGMSWTQYELWKAEQLGKKRLLWFYEGDAPTIASDTNAEEYQNQREWRAQLQSNLADGTTSDPFWFSFKDDHDLLQRIQKWIDNEPGLTSFRAFRWRSAVTVYRTVLRSYWEGEFPNVYPPERATPDQGLVPMSEDVYTDWEPGTPTGKIDIVSQGLQELDPPSDRGYLPHLQPAAFVVGNDTENESRHDTGVWKQVDLDSEIKWLLGKDASGVPFRRRLFLVSGGGVGKTQLISRIAYRASRDDIATDADNPWLACPLSASELARSEDSTEFLVTKLSEHPAFKGFRTEEVMRQVERQYKSSRLLLLVDGLDHISSNQRLPGFLANLDHSPWRDCPIVLSGRPYALQSRFRDDNDAIVADRPQLVTSEWRFCRPMEFDEHQQKIYLWKTESGTFRYDLIVEEARLILSNPRVLNYLKGINESDLKKIRTPADVYYNATRKLIRGTMENHKDASWLHPTRKFKGENDKINQKVEDIQVDYVMTLLAATAFVMTRTTSENVQPNYDHAPVNETFEREVHGRIRRFCSPEPDPPMPFVQFQTHFRNGLATFNTVINNGILDSLQNSKELVDVIWSNKSMQSFLVAYWLSKYGNNSLLGVLDPPDSTAFQTLVWYHESTYDDLHELNRFLAEMPLNVLDPKSWLNSIRAWYRPGARKRSSEMMFRTWPRLVAFAGEPLDDWWNTSYESLVFGNRIRTRPAGVNVQHPDARTILAEFRGELDQKLLSDETAAKEFIAPENWVTISSGEFQMGFPEALQGFPPKTASYWNRQLDRVIVMSLQAGEQEIADGTRPDVHLRVDDVANSAEAVLGKQSAYWRELLLQPIDAAVANDETSPTWSISRLVAEECNQKKWFVGAQGRRFRKEDVEWLTEVFQLLEVAAKRLGHELNVDWRALLEELKKERNDALRKIEIYWRRHDETPLELTQSVAAFDLQKYPIIYRWFGLFAPDHQLAVKSYLEETKVPGRSFSLPPDDHPVIYVSWFDAWAFCQWAQWTSPDGTKYRCRLPHEPEWEYAARRNTAPGFPHGVAIPWEQPYWWGPGFYPHEMEPEGVPTPEQESITNEFAHAVGDPGSTRPPSEAIPNGFGLHDILGNVWEWAANIYDQHVNDAGEKYSNYSRHFPGKDDKVAINSLRAMRGGLWYFLDHLSRVSSRFRLDSDDRDYKMGLRLVRERIKAPDDLAQKMKK